MTLYSRHGVPLVPVTHLSDLALEQGIDALLARDVAVSAFNASVRFAASAERNFVTERVWRHEGPPVPAEFMIRHIAADVIEIAASINLATAMTVRSMIHESGFVRSAIESSWYEIDRIRDRLARGAGEIDRCPGNGEDNPAAEACRRFCDLVIVAAQTLEHALRGCEREAAKWLRAPEAAAERPAEPLPGAAEATDHAAQAAHPSATDVQDPLSPLESTNVQ